MYVNHFNEFLINLGYLQKIVYLHEKLAALLIVLNCVEF